MSTELVTRDPAAIAEQVAIAGDLSKLSADQRMAYYGEVCKSLGLNPLTKPFQYLQLNGRMVLYATRDCTDQLRQARRVSITITGRDRLEDVYIVTARATTPDGRQDESTGVVSMGNLKGDNLANALMKAETKAKRRVTLSICGLGWMDESELETVPQARPVVVNERGEIAQGATYEAQNTASLQARVKALRQAEATYIGFGPAFTVGDAKDERRLKDELHRCRAALADFAEVDWNSEGANLTDERLIAMSAERRAVIDNTPAN